MWIFSTTPSPHPCLTPLYFKGNNNIRQIGVHGKFILGRYVVNMTSSPKWPSEPYSKPSGLTAQDLHSQGGVGLLLEVEPASTPDTDQEELFSKQEWQLACRVAASKGLNRSERLPQFLLYVCQQYLLGRAHEITEQHIGIQIFNRPTDYNPGEDNIVRSYARLLRKRLDIYFENEGSDELMRIIIPRGGYVPVFQSNYAIEEPIHQPASVIHPEENPDRSELLVPTDTVERIFLPAGNDRNENKDGKPSSRPVWLSGILGLIAGILIASACWLGMGAIKQQGEPGPAHAIWAQLFQQNRNTLIVPSDSGLGILQNLTRHLVSVQEYASGSYLSDMQLTSELDSRNFNDLRQERYTSVVSLNIASKLIRLPEFIANRTQVRYARSITAEDLKNSNVILLGSKHTNPWVSLFENKLNFQLEYTPEVDDSYVLNEQPVGSEQKIYRNGTDPTSNHTYGAIAYLPNLDGTGHVLIVQGLNMAATQAAADILFNADETKSILQQAVLPNGTLRPFELLIETTSVGATAPGAQIIATRIYP